VSEDFTLCLRVAEMGYSLYCDTRVLCRHLGIHPFSMVDFESALIVRQLFLNERVKHLCEFLNEPEQECYSKILSGQDILAAEWREKNPKTPEEIFEFYKTTKNYLFDLSMGDFLHYEDRRRWIYRICALGEPVLDFGAGVGTYTCWLADKGLEVSYADVDSVTRNFAMFAAEKKGLKDKITWFTDKPWEEAPDKKYKVIVALEVLEHVADFPGTVKHLWEMLEPGGFLIATYAPKEDQWPMHLLNSFKQFVEVLTAQGFEGFERNVWRKPKQG
jgi:2-polyprenyl-3-methyl-5-hydroxy-6-metoxy-1,4-benzoquinol methylase